jgi:CDP-diacylglycerol--glycerol-3-phosphate 3-phosphatidyltransferase
MMRKIGRIWTVSNALSFLRIVLAFPIAWCVQQNTTPARLYAVLLIILAAFTDLLDGVLARKLDQVTEMGKLIDPLADKLAVGVVCVLLVMQGKLPPWFVILVIARDLLIFSGGMYIRKRTGVTLQSNQAGKWAVTFIALYILFAIVGTEGTVLVSSVLLAVSVVMLCISFVLYLNRFIAIVKSREPLRLHTQN